MAAILGKYITTLNQIAEAVEASDLAGGAMAVGDAVERVIMSARATRDANARIFFIGNGGSAGIASHAATDYTKNGGFAALSLNDPSMLTCLGNDFGYAHVYEKQIEYFAHAGDLLVAISSSGSSANILNAVIAARERGCHVITFSGFKSNNPLRQTGDINFYIPSSEYGFVELSHQILIHAILDLSTGWQGEK